MTCWVVPLCDKAANGGVAIDRADELDNSICRYIVEFVLLIFRCIFRKCPRWPSAASFRVPQEGGGVLAEIDPIVDDGAGLEFCLSFLGKQYRSPNFCKGRHGTFGGSFAGGILPQGDRAERGLG